MKSLGFTWKDYIPTKKTSSFLEEKAMRVPLVCLCLLVLQGIGFTATIQVPQDYATIQEAIDAATSGDTISIAAGDYTEQPGPDQHSFSSHAGEHLHHER